jgi:flagella basal body P-ring formation protein FlgA
MLKLGILLLTTALLAETATSAERVVANRPIRAQSILGPNDISLARLDAPGALERVSDAVGMETRVNLYPGRPVHPQDLGPPAIVKKNQKAKMIFRSGALSIHAEGRVLERGGLGETIRIMNLSSRTIVLGRVLKDGNIEVSP